MFGVREVWARTVYSRSSTAPTIASAAVRSAGISAEVVRGVAVRDAGRVVQLSAFEAEPFEMLHLLRGSRLGRSSPVQHRLHPGLVGQLERVRQCRLVQRVRGRIQVRVLLA